MKAADIPKAPKRPRDFSQRQNSCRHPLATWMITSL
jgi:hypothetical protein